MISFSSTAIFSATDYGDIFYEENSDMIWPTASLAKVMNVLVALDAVDSKKVSLDDEITFDKETINIKGSYLDVSLNKKYTLRTLLEAELVYSANNAAYAVAKYIGGGDINKFVELMNKKASYLGLNDTVFYTPAGLPTSITKLPLDISTAKDLYKLAKIAIKDNRILEWTNKRKIIIDDQEYYTRNNNLGYFGNIGLKTGFHSLSKFNMIGINKIKNINLITVTLGDDTKSMRFKQQNEVAEQLMEKIKLVYQNGQFYKEIPVEYSNEKKIRTVIGKDFFFYDESFDIVENIIKLEETVNIGDKVGEIIITKNNQVIDKIPIIAQTSATALGIFAKIFEYIRNSLKHIL
ncbi:D-alanyl-D-alanine carboxypeptidase family protein [Caviibacter abscessus]|uniref:D-alanyl-D-alanine carboxypeptidase family protein n=1 Tax=Caviibacter abscessus TaxID=1766719 RepID=UPI000A726D37|nr:D-alanyl-D-alanine carboxypeptidase family protein [Caviibacter abscessus]